MTTTEINHPIKIDIIDADAIISRICTIDESYPLACAADDINSGTDFPYFVEPFSDRSKLHMSLPEAPEATKNDYVFTSIIPLEFAPIFFEKAGLASSTR